VVEQDASVPAAIQVYIRHNISKHKVMAFEFDSYGEHPALMHKESSPRALFSRAHFV